MIPFIMVITLQNRNFLFCVLCTLGTYMESNGPRIFRGLIFHEDNQDGALEPRERSPRAQKRGGGMTPTLGGATGMIGWHVARMPPIPSPYSSVWPKTFYKRGPRCDLRTYKGGDQKHLMRESEGRHRQRSEVGTAAEIAFGGLHPSPAWSS
jgi:hypothetical protein